MGQRGLLGTFFVKRRTLSTVPMPLQLGIVTAIRAHVVELECRTQLLRLKDEGLAERLRIARLRLTIALALTVELALTLLLLLALPEPFLEEGGYGVGDPLELLVALGLCDFEATCDMSPDEGHGDGVGTGCIGVDCTTCACLGLDGVEDGFGGEYEGTWWLSSRQARFGHVSAVDRQGGRVVGERQGRQEARGWW